MDTHILNIETANIGGKSLEFIPYLPSTIMSIQEIPASFVNMFKTKSLYYSDDVKKAGDKRLVICPANGRFCGLVTRCVGVKHRNDSTPYMFLGNRFIGIFWNELEWEFAGRETTTQGKDPLEGEIGTRTTDIIFLRKNNSQKMIGIVGVHLPVNYSTTQNGQKRIATLQSLCQDIAKVSSIRKIPIFMVGDFNTLPDQLYPILKQHGVCVHQDDRDTNWNDATGFHGRLDYVCWVGSVQSGPLKVINNGIKKNLEIDSDHALVSTKFIL